MRRLLGWFVFWVGWVAAFVLAIHLAVPAHADEQSDYLDCLPGYGLPVTDKAKAAKVGEEVIGVLRSHQLIPTATALNLYVEIHYNVPPYVATVVGNCAQISALKNGGYGY